MKLTTAILSGLLLNVGLVGAVSAQGYGRYDQRYQRYDQRYERGDAWRYGVGSQWQAQRMVREAYRDILRRDPDPSGMAQYTNAILYRGWTDAEVRQSLLSSPEYQQRFGGFGRHSFWRRY